jgi:hypothetical protein
VAASQKPMQSASDLPPPPGLLGADSLGLEEEVPGDSARFGEEPPPVANWVATGSDMGESAGSAGSGVAGAAGPVAAGSGVGVGVGAAAPPVGAAAVAVGVAGADARAFAVAVLTVAVAPWVRTRDAMPDACPPLPEECASAVVDIKEVTRSAVAGRKMSVDHHPNLGVSMLTPLSFLPLRLSTRDRALPAVPLARKRWEPRFSGHHKLASEL